MSHSIISGGFLFKSNTRRYNMKSLGNILQGGFMSCGFSGGVGFFSSGLTVIVTVDNQPAVRKVFVLEQQSLRFVASTWSDTDGTWRINGLNPNREYIIMSLDNHDSNYRPVAWDKRKPIIG